MIKLINAGGGGGKNSNCGKNGCNCTDLTKRMQYTYITFPANGSQCIPMQGGFSNRAYTNGSTSNPSYWFIRVIVEPDQDASCYNASEWKSYITAQNGSQLISYQVPSNLNSKVTIEYTEGCMYGVCNSTTSPYYAGYGRRFYSGQINVTGPTTNPYGPALLTFRKNISCN